MREMFLCPRSLLRILDRCPRTVWQITHRSVVYMQWRSPSPTLGHGQRRCIPVRYQQPDRDGLHIPAIVCTTRYLHFFERQVSAPPERLQHCQCSEASEVALSFFNIVKCPGPDLGGERGKRGCSLSMATTAQTTTPEAAPNTGQAVDKINAIQCRNDLEESHGAEAEEPAQQAGGAVVQEPVSMPFESFLADGSLPPRPRSFIEETYEMRYIADCPSLGDDMWVCRRLPHPS